MKAAIDAWLRGVYGGRRWLLGVDVAPYGRGLASRLGDYGAAGSFIVAARDGAGGPAPREDVPERVLGLPEMPFLAAIRASEEALRALPPDVQAAIDAWDPARRAMALGSIFSDGRDIAGRRFFGARPLAWQALEDKTTIDALWDAVGVERAPSVSVPVAEARDAAARLDRGDGTVWAADMSRGFHGGAGGTWWVRGDPTDAEAFFAREAERVRVMPFLDGIPCSIHGVVLRDHVVVLRPNEMIVLRRPSGNGFVYARAATFWDPPAAVRDAMRAAARTVGEVLRGMIGYRGAFTIDGVATRDGFRPTELNPRVGAALGAMGTGVPFDLWNAALVAGEPFPLPGEAAEAEFLAGADAKRGGSVMFLFDAPVAATTEHPLVWTGAAWRAADAGEAPHTVVTVGPGPSGGFLMAPLTRAFTPVGPSVGPRAVALAAWADAVLGAGIGAVEAAPDLRG